MESETENVRHLSKVVQCVQNPGQVVGFSGGTKVRLAILPPVFYPPQPTWVNQGMLWGAYLNGSLKDALEGVR